MSKKVKTSLYLLACVLMIALDQVSKAHIVKYLKGHENIVWLKNIFELEYLENNGAAFSSFSGKQGFLITLTTLVIIFLFVELFRIPNAKRYGFLRVSFAMLISGAIGNLIDRLRQGYVVDFFYFKPINFPRFNVADIYVTVSMALLIIVVFFYYKDDETEFLFNFKKK